MANAIHQGISGVRGPSDLIKATAGTGKDAPKEITLTFTGGTDGAEKSTAQSSSARSPDSVPASMHCAKQARVLRCLLIAAIPRRGAHRPHSACPKACT